MRQISKYMDKLTISPNCGESNNHTSTSHVIVIHKMKQNAKKPLSNLGEANDHTIHSKFKLLMIYLIWTKKISPKCQIQFFTMILQAQGFWLPQEEPQHKNFLYTTFNLLFDAKEFNVTNTFAQSLYCRCLLLPTSLCLRSFL